MNAGENNKDAILVELKKNDGSWDKKSRPENSIDDGNLY